jgi:hypothetical protein
MLDGMLFTGSLLKTRVRFYHLHRATLELVIGPTSVRPPDQNVETGSFSTVAHV